jgi:putative IMPACT (imprinted ancient) family translation regulator
MDALELRKNLHNQIEHLDEKTLEAVYLIIQDYFGGNKHFELSKAHKSLIDERLEDYEKNPQNVISWEESSRLLKKYL